MSILVTGGAGYIGSHAAKVLKAKGEDVVVVDNLYTGHKWAIPKDVPLYELDYGDPNQMAPVFEKHKIESVLHFGGYIEVEESTREPEKYFENNTIKAFSLLKQALGHGLKHFIFSSTCATYGEPELIPISEDTPQNPVNPYGQSKLLFERMLMDMQRAHPSFSYMILRYFNVAGASPDGDIGQSYPRSTHLIKVAAQVVTGQLEKIKIFGTDYETRDGTCIRDYIHVMDLAEVHRVALEYLQKGGKSDFLNCGYGRGFTVREVIETMKEVSGVDFKVEETERRAGDPPELVCDTTKLSKALNIEWKYNDLKVICQSALDWEKKSK